MIERTVTGDITSPRSNPDADIIIGMNTECWELTALARTFLGLEPRMRLEKGTVLTFRFDEHRRIHMIVCHDLKAGGWDNAPKFLRLGLDLLWRERMYDVPPRKYAIVRIGAGRVGQMDGADPIALYDAMVESFLPLTLFYRRRAAAGAAAPLVSDEMPIVSAISVVSKTAM